MLTGRLGARLSTWIDAVDASQPPGLTGFALHLLRDLDAVTSVIPHHVTRIPVTATPPNCPRHEEVPVSSSSMPSGQLS
jgi:hypothetical protein